MKTVYMSPAPEQAAKDDTNAINRIVLKFAALLPEHGYELVEDPGKAELFVGNAGLSDPKYPLHLAINHGLYPTQDYPEQAWTWHANRNVIQDLKRAQAITVPSEWVAQIIKRDMHVKPYILPWAVDAEDWRVLPLKQRTIDVLWNKTRTGGVCDPAPMNALAQRLPNMRFASTFGAAGHNVKLFGKMSFEENKLVVEHSKIYLATTRETFGIGTLEAMASGCPVLGYDWAGTVDLVTHGENGWLARPGDIDGLVAGFEHIASNWPQMSQKARKTACEAEWGHSVRILAAILDRLPREASIPRLSVIIPAHNYEQYIKLAMESVVRQDYDYSYELVVAVDKSTDKTLDIVKEFCERFDARSNVNPRCTVHYLETNYGNPAGARNEGIEESTGDYILCLDADDYLLPDALKTFSQYLDAHSEAGVVYGKLQVIDAAGQIRQMNSDWPGFCDVNRQLQGYNQVPSCCMFRREAWQRAGGYRSLFVPAEDAELWARMMLFGFEAHLEPSGKARMAYRMHGESLSAPIRMERQREPQWTLNLHFPTPMVSVQPPANQSHTVRNYDQPLFSIIIPVGPNHHSYLFEALDSVQAQSDWRWECVVVNDCGLPLRDWLDDRGYPWVKLLEAPDMSQRMGPGRARNMGVQASRGRYLVFLDADDMLDPQYLEKTYKHFRATGKYVYTDWIAWTLDGKKEANSAPEYDANLIFQKGAIHGVTCLVPRVDYDMVGGFPEDMQSWEDMEFFLRFAAAGCCGSRLAEPLYIYRYKTGTMRERAGHSREKLVQYIHTKYHQQLEASRVKALDCGCGAPRKKIEPEPPDGEMLRVVYEGRGVPTSPVPLRGVATHQYYKQKARGDVFFVWKKDFEAMRDVLHLVEEYEAEDHRI